MLLEYYSGRVTMKEEREVEDDGRDLDAYKGLNGQAKRSFVFKILIFLHTSSLLCFASRMLGNGCMITPISSPIYCPYRDYKWRGKRRDSIITLKYFSTTYLLFGISTINSPSR
jgi:hypothetical protein